MPNPKPSPLSELRRLAAILIHRGTGKSGADARKLPPPGVPTARDALEHSHASELLQTSEPTLPKR